jgi:hypothetical protein
MIIDLLIEEKKAKRIIEVSENKANNLIIEAKERAKIIQTDAISKIKIDHKKKEDVDIRKEVIEIDKEYAEKKEDLRNKALNHMDQAVDFLVKEVLNFDRE